MEVLLYLAEISYKLDIILFYVFVCGMSGINKTAEKKDFNHYSSLHHSDYIHNLSVVPRNDDKLKSFIS